jgi:hypothetical protein
VTAALAVPRGTRRARRVLQARLRLVRGIDGAQALQLEPRAEPLGHLPCAGFALRDSATCLIATVLQALRLRDGRLQQLELSAGPLDGPCP